ncbi:MMS19 nucleotide excision repair protein homolog isoform X2 [Porites lutea]|uniref:MMS19 nucleotide excision repair protein homolog isoform X2 n=1 Tax=Porites lutea TaxID=51062 RepID=UPI003CC612F1
MAAIGASEINKEESTEKSVSKIVQDIRSKRLDLVTFVEDLGPELTSSEVERRCHGVCLLSGVLHHLVGFPFQEKEVVLFSEFLCDRLKDHYTIIPHALFGILSLTTSQALSEADSMKIIQTIFKEVHVQSLLKEARLTTFNLFAVFLNKHLNALKKIANDFVFGFIQAVDGEKDPRNLLLVFELTRIIISNFSIDLFAEDLFEVTSCYFPIDFTPPADDPYGIKKDDLVSSLRKCLASTNQFAPFCLPLLMEKLSSDITDAKIDSLLTLSACLEVYQSTYLLEYLESLWTAIKSVVFYPTNSELEEASLTAVTSIVKNLSTSIEENARDKYEEFLDTIHRDCGHLTGSDVKLMRSSGKILQAAALGAEPACRIIIESTFPLLLEQFKGDVEIAHKKNFISTITNLLKAAKVFHRQADGSPVLNYKEVLSATLFSFLSSDNSALSCVAVDCLMALVDLIGLMSEQEVELLVQHLTSIVLANRELFLSRTSLTALTQLSKDYPSIILTEVVLKLQKHLQKEDRTAMDTDSDEPQSTPLSHQSVLDTLNAVCTQDSVVREVIPRLVEHAKHLCHENPSADSQLRICRVFQCILSVVEGCIQEGVSSAGYFKLSLIPEVMKIVLKSALKGSTESAVELLSKEILDVIAAILRTVTSNLDIEAAHILLDDFVVLYLDGKSSSLEEAVDVPFRPFELSTPLQQTQLVSLLTATVCSARREVTIPRHADLLPRLQHLACHCDHERSVESGAQCLAGIINKFPDGDQLTTILNNLINRIWQISDKESSKKRATITWLWLTKAVVVRSHPLAPQFIEKVLSLLTDKDVGRLAADGFYVIMADYEEVMNVKMHVNYRMMYRQRLFMETAPKLIQGFHSADAEFKHHYLCALSHLLQWIPKQVLLSEVPNLMPLLIQSLSCEEQTLQQSTLQTMYSLVLDAPEIITRHVTSLVPMFLALSKFQLSMKIRMEALKCLGAMTTLPHHAVYPYKTKVCRALAESVDDKKRLVRKEAVKCRNEWYLLGSSTR